MIFSYLSYAPKIHGYDRMYDQDIRNYVRSIQIGRLKHAFLKIKGRILNKLQAKNPNDLKFSGLHYKE